MEPIGHGHVRRVGGTSIAWSEIGAGEPLVLIHGVGDSHRTWRRVAPRLADCYRVLMPDLPGHGLSGRPDAPYTLPWFAAVMLEWLDSLDVGRARVVGHSYGGGVAQWMLLEQPQRVARLALVAPGGFGRDVTVGLRLPVLPVLGPALTPLLMQQGTRVLMRVALGGRVSREEREEIERLAWLNSAPGTGVAFQRTIAGCIDLFGQTVQTSQKLGEVRAPLPPLAIFWGERDGVLPVRHAHAAARRLGGAEVHLYAGSGHCPHLDESERFARDLREFLA
jgi:pimeloyl-ACP methyl ester carboxylesterase